MVKRLIEGKLFYGGLGLVALTGGFALALVTGPGDQLASSAPVYEPPEYPVVGSTDQPTGPELMAVYIGASGCAASNHPDLPPAVEAIKGILADRAEANGFGFAAMGVALDWSLEAGYRHLEAFGHFDEISTGRNWLNNGALDYIWEDVPGEPVTPQLLVVQREIDGPDAQSPREAYSVSEPEVVTRKVGSDAIRQWAQRDVPLPSGTFEPDGE